MTSPYRNILDEHDGDKVRNQIRWRKTIEFMKGDYKPSGNRVLDIGDRSVITEQLSNMLQGHIINTCIDLDTEPLTGRDYDMITCFEVLEHLFNPLWCLVQMREALSDDGIMYISTPRYKPHFLWGDHFHEMSEQSILALFERAGLRIVRRKTIFIMPWRSLLTGFRPWLRLIFDRVYLFELETQGE